MLSAEVSEGMVNNPPVTMTLQSKAKSERCTVFECFIFGVISFWLMFVWLIMVVMEVMVKLPE